MALAPVRPVLDAVKEGPPDPVGCSYELGFCSAVGHRVALSRPAAQHAGSFWSHYP